MSDKEQNKRSVRRAIPFFAVLALLTALAFNLPLRPSRSLAERRLLAKFPAWSEESFWNGTYFDQITLWFADTFPGRDLYLDAARELESLHGLNKNVVMDGAVDTADNERLDELLDAAPTPAPTELPADRAEPEPKSTVDPMAEIEDWEGLDAEDEMAMYGNLVALGDMVFARLGFSEISSDMHVALCNRTGDMLAEKGVRFFNLPAPSSVGVLVASDFLPQIGCADQGKILRYMFERENENVYKVNAFNTLLAHSDEYIYFRGDHHWTALGAYYAYEAFCAEAGFAPVPLSEYEEKNMGLFYGTYFYSAGSRSKWADEVIAYIPPGEVRMDLPHYPNLTEPVVDMSNAGPPQKYNCFIGGDNEVTVLTNDSLPDAGTCLVIKDSFGNPFVIYLTQHYHKVVVVDYRHADYRLPKYVEDYAPRDVILVQGIGVSQTKNAIGQLEKIC